MTHLKHVKQIMKQVVRCLFVPLAAAVLILSGCDSSKEEVEAMKQEVNSLTERISTIENTEIKALEGQVTSLQKEIEALQGADRVQAEDISVLDGKMSVISDDLAQLKETVSSLSGTTEDLSYKISAINAKLSKLESQITSILASISELREKVNDERITFLYIPKYADNIEPVQYTMDHLKISGTATLDFMVKPSGAAKTIAKDWKSSISTIALYTLTKSTGGEKVDLPVSDVSANDDVLSIKLNVNELGKDFITGDIGAALAVKVSYGGIQFATDYINLAPVMKEKNLITYLLKNFDKDGDCQIEDLDKVTFLDVSGLGITSMDDVLYQMPALDSLNCRNNKLTSIDLSKNESLTSVNLYENADLTKVVCKSLDWILSRRVFCSNLDVLFYQPDGTQITLENLSMTIDGKTWQQFNAGATPCYDNIHGRRYKFDEALSACPAGWRLPTIDELKSLSDHFYKARYFGVPGLWFSGSQTYSESVPAIFLPSGAISYGEGHYWSSTEGDNGYAYVFYFEGGRLWWTYNYKQPKTCSVRCIKK